MDDATMMQAKRGDIDEGVAREGGGESVTARERTSEAGSSSPSSLAPSCSPARAAVCRCASALSPAIRNDPEMPRTLRPRLVESSAENSSGGQYTASSDLLKGGGAEGSASGFSGPNGQAAAASSWATEAESLAWRERRPTRACPFERWRLERWRDMDLRGYVQARALRGRRCGAPAAVSSVVADAALARAVGGHYGGRDCEEPERALAVWKTSTTIQVLDTAPPRVLILVAAMTRPAACCSRSRTACGYRIRASFSSASCSSDVAAQPCGQPRPLVLFLSPRHRLLSPLHLFRRPG